jgi:hypothetical protein
VMRGRCGQMSMFCLHDRGFGGRVSGKGTAGVGTGKFRPKKGREFSSAF